MALDEAVAIYRDGTSIRRTTATDMSSPLSPIWAPANELAMNVTGLQFHYYDQSGTSVSPDSLPSRASVRKVIVNMRVQASQELSDGSRPEFAVEMSSILRNLR